MGEEEGLGGTIYVWAVMIGGVGTDGGLEGEGCCADVEGGGGLVCVCGGAVWACVCGFGEGG